MRGNFLGRHHCAHGEAVSDALGHGDDVGLDAVGLEAPVVGAAPPEAGLNLISHAHAAMGAHRLVDAGQVALGVLVRAANTL